MKYVSLSCERYVIVQLKTKPLFFIVACFGAFALQKPLKTRQNAGFAWF